MLLEIGKSLGILYPKGTKNSRKNCLFVYKYTKIAILSRRALISHGSGFPLSVHDSFAGHGRIPTWSVAHAELP
jgi:hypothetical protein